MMKQPRVIFNTEKWQELVDIAKTNTRFRAFTLFQRRRKRYPCEVVDYKEINVILKKSGIFRFPEVEYPIGTPVRNCGELIMQNQPLELTHHTAYWMGFERTNLVIYMKNGVDEDYRGFWVDTETDGEFIPVKVELG